MILFFLLYFIMYEIKLPDFSIIPEDRKEYLKKNADELCRKYNLNKYVDEDYYPWEKMKYMEVPSELNNSEELYFVVRCLRRGTATCVKSSNWEYFTMNIPPFVQKLLSDLDRKWIGLQSDINNVNKFNLSQTEKDYLSQEWILEEAISSSQIEWAETTANVAKEIIIRNREPQNKHEKMIVNNYQAMMFISNEMKDAVLSEQLLLDLQTILTKDTLDDEWKSWRFRTDQDNIVVMNGATWEVYYKPPKEHMMKQELKNLIDFANDKDNSYIHPFIKATILHFWIAYLHPFCDGNGRTARAIFYWYLNKKWYTDFTYIPISRVINNSKKQYGQTYIYAEQEEFDLTFFVVYIAQKTQQAFKEYGEFILTQKKEHSTIQDKVNKIYGKMLNDRQLSLICYFLENPDKYINNTIYQNQYRVVKNTAKADLLWLKELSLLEVNHNGKYINYYPTKKLLDLWNMK